MATAPVLCLHTRVRNISASRKFFSYLQPGGVWLDADEELDVPGNLVDRLAANREAFEALQASLGVSLEIIHSPSAIMLDPITHETRMLKVTNSVLGTDDPCWGEYTSTS